MHPAVSGKFLDLDHPAARQYIAEHTADPEDRDPLYDQALNYCIANGFKTRPLRRLLGIGYKRAKALIDQFREDGRIPPSMEPDPVPSPPSPDPVPFVEPDPVPSPPSPEPRRPHRRGGAAANDRKRADAWDVPEVEQIEGPEDWSEFSDMTLGEILEQYGTDIRFSDWLNAKKKIEEIRERRLKSEAREGQLVNRDLVVRMVSAINEIHLKLLNDGAASITTDVAGWAKAGVSEDEIVIKVREVMSTFITPGKRDLERLLRERTVVPRA